MSDIIKDAEQLLDGATPGKWEHYDDHGIVSLASGEMAIATDLNAWDADLIAAAPELAQALAEDSYEYSYHIQNAIGMWEHPTPRAGDPERWWDTRGEAEESALAAHEYGYPIRIVRRRVSPPEVINV